MNVLTKVQERGTKQRRGREKNEHERTFEIAAVVLGVFDGLSEERTRVCGDLREEADARRVERRVCQVAVVERDEVPVNERGSAKR